MKLKSVIGCIITYLLFTSPVLSMNLRDTKPQQDVLQVPITIIKETPNRYRSNCPIVIEAYYQSGYIVFDFFEMRENAIVTISNSTNDVLEYFVNASDGVVLLDVSEILSNGTFNIYVITESNEAYSGTFLL